MQMEWGTKTKKDRTWMNVNEMMREISVAAAQTPQLFCFSVSFRERKRKRETLKREKATVKIWGFKAGLRERKNELKK